MVIGPSTLSASNYAGHCATNHAHQSGAPQGSGHESALLDSAQRQKSLLQGAGFTSLSPGQELNSGFPPFI